MQNGYKAGLVSVSFRDRTPEEILRAMQQAGLACIEWGSDVHAPCDDLENLQRLAALQSEYGVLCCSYGTYFRLGETPLAHLPRYIAAAKILGTDILRLWCGGKSGADMTEAEREALLLQCTTAAALARDAGVTLCMECHKRTFTERPTDAVWLMEQVGSPHFRMYWQPFQWQTVCENCENAQRLAPYALHVHVFNWRGKERLPLGDAIPAWRSYLQHFAAPRTLLLEFMPDDEISSLAREVGALREIIGGLR